MVAVGPQLLQPIFAQEHRGQVGLGVEIGGNHRYAKLRVHPSEVVPQGGLAYPSLVVEERYRGHGFLRMLRNAALVPTRIHTVW